MVFTNLCFFVDEQSNSIFKLAPLNLLVLTNFKNPSSIPLQRPESGDLHTKNAYRKPPVILQNHTRSHL
jgi:hypothetical protein